MEPEILLRALKAVVVVAGFALVGQAIVPVLSGARREQHIIDPIFRIETGPVFWARVILIVGLANPRRLG